LKTTGQIFDEILRDRVTSVSGIKAGIVYTTLTFDLKANINGSAIFLLPSDKSVCVLWFFLYNWYRKRIKN